MASKSTPLKRKIDSKSETPSKKRKWLSLEQKLEIIKKYESGASYAKMAHEKEMAESSVRLILKDKDQIMYN